MAFNPLKEFFKRKKAEVKFSRAGPAHKLSSDTEGPTTSQATSAKAAAAEAAMKRFNQDPGRRPPAQKARTSQTNNPTPARKQEEEEEKLKQSTEEPETDDVGEIDRKIQVFTLEELAQRIKAPDIDDNFFRMTAEDAELIKKRYDEARKKNEVLMTSEMRRRLNNQPKRTSKVCRIRFKLPNSLVLESSFKSTETLDEIRAWLIKACLDKTRTQLNEFDILLGHIPFKPKDMSKSALDAGLVPASTLTIVERQSKATS